MKTNAAVSVSVSAHKAQICFSTPAEHFGGLIRRFLRGSILSPPSDDAIVPYVLWAAVVVKLISSEPGSRWIVTQDTNTNDHATHWSAVRVQTIFVFKSVIHWGNWDMTETFYTQQLFHFKNQWTEGPVPSSETNNPGPALLAAPCEPLS